MLKRAILSKPKYFHNLFNALLKQRKKILLDFQKRPFSDLPSSFILELSSWN